MVNCATWVVIRAIRLSAATRRACRLGSCRIPASAASRPWWGDATGLSRPVARRDSRLVSVPRSSAKEARCCRLVPRRAGSRPVRNSEFFQLESAKRTNSAAILSKPEEPVEAMEQGGLMSASSSWVSPCRPGLGVVQEKENVTAVRLMGKKLLEIDALRRLRDSLLPNDVVSPLDSSDVCPCLPVTLGEPARPILSIKNKFRII